MKKQEFLLSVHTLQTMALQGEFPGVSCVEVSTSFVPEIGQIVHVFVHPRGEYDSSDILSETAIHDGDETMASYCRIRQRIDELNEKAGL